MSASVAAHFAAQMGALLGPDFPKHIALAVSGGGDSMAMLHLAHGWARHMGVGVWVVTVDHGLRDESAAEAQMVRDECDLLGRPHATLRWHWDGQGNLQAAARTARLTLIDRWRAGLEHVLFAHTEDDVAETFLMRLARGSGVEGLCAMAALHPVVPHPNAGHEPMRPDEVDQTDAPPEPTRIVAGVRGCSRGFQQVRPLLGISRAALRHYADTLQIPYVNDPTNDDPKYDRVKARKALVALAPLGLDAKGIAQTAERMTRAATALRRRAVEAARASIRPAELDTHHILFDRDGFGALERDTQMRLLAAALQWIANDPYRPRASALDALLDRILGGGGGPLHGAQVIVAGDSIRVFREYDAVRDMVSATGPVSPWDNMHLISGPKIKGLDIRALGAAGWSQIAEKPPGHPPFAASLSLPAVFSGDTLVACRALEFGPSYVHERRGLARDFITFLESR